MTQKQTTHPARAISIEKVTLNCGCGTDHARLEKSVKLLKRIANQEPVKTITQARIPNWQLRPGLPIGTRVTLRGEKAKEVLLRILEAKDRTLKASCFDNNGNVSFGVPEYINIPGVEYDPELGIIGLQVSVTLRRPGFSIRRRNKQQQSIPAKHRITQADAIEYATASWNMKIAQEE